MNKQEFLSALRDKLSGLSEEDIEKSIEYYSEMTDDRIEDGLSEEEAVAALGSVDEISSRILLDTPLPKLVKAKVKSQKTLRAWEIVLIVLGAPLWLSLIITAFALILSLYIVIWAVFAALYITVLALCLCAIGCVVVIFLGDFTNTIAGVLFLVGAAIICIALAIFIFCGSVYVLKGFLLLHKTISKKIKYCFIGKESTK